MNVGRDNSMPSTTSRSALRFFKGAIHQYGFRLILGEVPRLVYGNDAGFVENFSSRRQLARLRAQIEDAIPDRDERAEFLRREGYVLLPSAYGGALLQVIHARFQALIVDDHASRPIGPRLSSAIRGIIDPVRRIPELGALVTPEIRHLIQAYYGTHFNILHVRLWRNVHVPPEYARQDVYSNLWHNDHDPVTLLRLFVCLSDRVTRETGALRFHSIPTTKRIIRTGYLRRRAILPPARRILEDERRVMYFEGGLGSACLLNPQLCLHSATVPRAGAHRDMAQFTIAPSASALPVNWAELLPPDPDVRA
jgi:hypothetical protein